MGTGHPPPAKGRAPVIYAHLVLYTGLRILMHRAAVNRSEPLDPDRLSFAAALRAARRSITSLNRDFPPSAPFHGGP